MESVVCAVNGKARRVLDCLSEQRSSKLSGYVRKVFRGKDNLAGARKRFVENVRSAAWEDAD